MSTGQGCLSFCVLLGRLVIISPDRLLDKCVYRCFLKWNEKSGNEASATPFCHYVMSSYIFLSVLILHLSNQKTLFHEYLLWQGILAFLYFADLSCFISATFFC